MEKKIKIDSKTSLTLSNNIGWLFIYRDQFGRDIVPVLIPALNAGIDLAVNVLKATGGQGIKGIESIDPEVMKDALIDAAGLEMVDILNIVWAMAKNADEDIEPPREWVRQFDTFPLDVIGPAVFELLYKGMISTKNSRRLQTLFESLKPESTSTAS